MRTHKPLTKEGVIITQLCTAQDIRHKEMARRLGMQPQNYSRLLRGERPLRWETMVEIADALGVSLDALAGRET